MSKARPAPRPPGTPLAGYRVLRRLSAGGFGIVYLALDSLRGTYSDNLIEVVAWCMSLDAPARPQALTFRL